MAQRMALRYHRSGQQERYALMGRSRVHDFLSAEQIAALRRPTREACGLPRRAFTDEAFFRLEEEALLPRQWMGVAYADRLPDPGDTVPATVAGLPIVLVHGDDGEIRAFHNVCRHRGTIVVEAPLKRARTLRCRYHSWTWDLAGRLRSRPLWDGREDEAEDCLVAVRCRTWCNIVFVTLSEKTPDFEEYFGFLWRRWEPFDFEALAPFAIRDWPVEANWKLHAQGVIEPYHEPFLHPQIVNTITDPDTGEKKFDHDTFTAQLEGNCIGVTTPGADRDYNWSGNFPLLPGPADDHDRGQDIFLLFPNTTVAIAPDHVLTMICTPEAVGRCTVSVALFVAREAADDPALASDRESLLEDWVLVTEQDLGALALQQAGHASPVADMAKFSPFWEGTAHYFERHVVEQLDAAAAVDPGSERT